MAARTASLKSSDMLEGKWIRLPSLTLAQACASAAVLRAYLAGSALTALTAAMRLARCCAVVDVADCFCDGIALALSLPVEERPAAIERMYLNCRVAAGVC